jgi:NADH-quinone oxidoreductase subunit D
LNRKGYPNSLPWVEKVDYLCSSVGALAYCQLKESLLSIEVAPRAKMIRILLLELGRISSHLHSLAFVAKAVGAMTARQFFLQNREKLCDLLEVITGSRLAFNFFTLGGVYRDLSHGYIEKISDFVQYLLTALVDQRPLLEINPVFLSRLKGRGFIKQAQIRKFGISGPTARAARVFADCRWNSADIKNPYQELKSFDHMSVAKNFNMDLDLQGDALGRHQVRLLEILQSLMMVQHLTKMLPSGQTNIERDFSSDHELNSKLSQASNATRTIDIEGPRGRFQMVWDKGLFSINSPSVALLACAPEIISGETLNDIELVLSSLDILISEVDL